LNDPTLKVKLHDTVSASYPNSKNERVVGTARVPMRRKVVLTINQYINRRDNKPFVNDTDVAVDLLNTREILAQVGVGLEVKLQRTLAQPSSVDLSDGLSMYPHFPTLLNPASEHAEFLALVERPKPFPIRERWEQTSLRIDYVNILTVENKKPKGFFTGVTNNEWVEIVMAGKPIPPGTKELPDAGEHDFQDLAHEIGHTLNLKHEDGPSRQHVMRKGPLPNITADIYAPRRITGTEEDKLFQHLSKAYKWFPVVDDPPELIQVK
jgi:hypothetical protein